MVDRIHCPFVRSAAARFHTQQAGFLKYLPEWQGVNVSCATTSQVNQLEHALQQQGEVLEGAAAVAADQHARIQHLTAAAAEAAADAAAARSQTQHSAAEAAAAAEAREAAAAAAQAQARQAAESEVAALRQRLLGARTALRESNTGLLAAADAAAGALASSQGDAGSRDGGGDVPAAATLLTPGSMEALRHLQVKVCGCRLRLSGCTSLQHSNDSALPMHHSAA